MKNHKIDSLNNTIESAEDLEFTSQIYMGINILLVLLVIGLILYLVYSNFNASSNNSNSINNIYKNIKINSITLNHNIIII